MTIIDLSIYLIWQQVTIESENTPENASWAKGELLEIFERNAQIEESVKNIVIGMVGGGSSKVSKSGILGKSTSSTAKGWIKRSTYKEIGEILGKRAQQKFSNAMKKGIVDAEGMNGIKILSGK